MDIDAGQRAQFAGHRRSKTVVQTGCGHADQHDAPAQLVRGDIAREDARETQLREVLRIQTKGDQETAFASVIGGGLRCRCVAGKQSVRSLVQLQHTPLDGLCDRHHQLRPARIRVALEPRDATHNAVAVDFKVDMPKPGRGMRERRHRFDRDAPAGVVRRRQQHRQIGGTQGDRAGELGIFRISFGKEHVVDHRGRLRLRNLFEQLCVDAARPRPAAKLRNAGVVDFEHHDVAQQRLRAQAQKTVVDQVVDAGGQPAERAEQNYHQAQAADRHPFDQEAATGAPAEAGARIEAQARVWVRQSVAWLRAKERAGWRPGPVNLPVSAGKRKRADRAALLVETTVLELLGDDRPIVDASR